MLEFVKSAPGCLYCVYLRRHGRAAWVGTIRPPAAGAAAVFHARAPMGWDAAYSPSPTEAETIRKFLLTLQPAAV